MAESGTHNQPTTGKMVNGDSLAGDFPWLPAGHWRQEDPDTDSLRAQRDGGQRDPRVGNGRPDEDVLQKNTVPTGSLGLVRDLAQQPRVGVRTVHRHVDSKLHGTSTFLDSSWIARATDTHSRARTIGRGFLAQQGFRRYYRMYV